MDQRLPRPADRVEIAALPDAIETVEIVELVARESAAPLFVLRYLQAWVAAQLERAVVEVKRGGN